jgi:hypothetical protein
VQRELNKTAELKFSNHISFKPEAEDKYSLLEVEEGNEMAFSHKMQIQNRVSLNF